MVRNCAPENLEIPGSALSSRPGMTVCEAITKLIRRSTTVIFNFTDRVHCSLTIRLNLLVTDFEPPMFTQSA